MNKTLLIAAVIAAVIWYESQNASGDTQDEGLVDSTMTKFDEAMGAISGPGPVGNMSTSQDMLDMLKARERLSLTPYNLGDGGWTVGYGHFEKTRDALPVLNSKADADALFASDVANRGEKWVKLYITVPLTQNQFDALVSIAFNMSPQSFKKFADSVNAGNGIDDIAQASVAWVKPEFQNGIQNRRDAEMNVFDNGEYA